MIYGLIILLLGFFVSMSVINKVVGNNTRARSFLLKLYWYHSFLAIVYYVYALFNPSDSHGYYIRASGYDSWFSLYGTSTTFIDFLGYPFINYLGFSYEAMMVLFSTAGFIGIIFFYQLFSEKLRFRHTWNSLDLKQLIFLLPNLHFWSSSFGKGSLILLAMGMFFYGLLKFKSRFIITLSGAILIYHIRPHIMFVILGALLLAVLLSSKGLSFGLRITFLVVGITAFIFIYEDVLQLIGMEDQNIVEEGLDLSKRARELSKATSGIDINSYSLPEKMFAFIYRPLFFDAPGALGLIVSVENLILLLLSFAIIRLSFLKFIVQADFFIKTSFISFFMLAVALAQITGNLGIAIRQKSQIILLFFLIIMAFKDDTKWVSYQNLIRTRRNRQRKQTEYQKLASS